VTVHLISVEQASYLDVALQTRGADEPFPPCPVCQERPTGVSWWRDRTVWPPERIRFEDCGHVISVDWDTYGTWCAQADANPWVEMFEDHSHQQQVRAKEQP
jgi:hypothetical protein